MVNKRVSELSVGQLQNLIINDYAVEINEDGTRILRISAAGAFVDSEVQNIPSTPVSKSEPQIPNREQELIRQGGEIMTGIRLTRDRSQIPPPPWSK